MISERWIHAQGLDTLVYISDDKNRCVPGKNADANCPIYGNSCAHIVRNGRTEEHALSLIQYSMGFHLKTVHGIH